jgi:Fe/S biogenesis protein NfuA
MATTTEDLQAASPASAVVTLTPEAFKIVAEALQDEYEKGLEEHPGDDTTAPAAETVDQGRLALWLEVRGVEAGSFVYDLYFQGISDADDGDAHLTQDGLDIVVPAPSVDRLRGARLEWSDEGGGGLVLVNPNSPTPEEASPGVPPEVLAKGISGTLATRVVAVLEQSVNPAIASHGGRADLVALNDEDGTAYLRLSGGCQGCAMSQMTLRQGIETTLLEEVPELTRILDVTDHGSGENPFYS